MLSLDKDLIWNAKLISVKGNSSISSMLSQELKRIVKSAEKYEIAKKKTITDLCAGYHLGGIIAASRKELHEK